MTAGGGAGEARSSLFGLHKFMRKKRKPSLRQPSPTGGSADGGGTDRGGAAAGSEHRQWSLGTGSRNTGNYHDKGVSNIAAQVKHWEAGHSGKDGHGMSSSAVKCPIDPRSNPWIGWWDFVLSFALIFTAVFTPVEVGFIPVPKDRWADPLFIVNRVVDMIFIIDMSLQFCLMVSATPLVSPPRLAPALPRRAGGGGSPRACVRQS